MDSLTTTQTILLKNTRHDVKNFPKCHITIDVDSRMILYLQAVNGQIHNIKFVIVLIRTLIKYNPQFIIDDKAYGSNTIRTCINEEINASDQISLKSNFSTDGAGLSIKTFKKRNMIKKKQCKKCI